MSNECRSPKHETYPASHTRCSISRFWVAFDIWHLSFVIVHELRQILQKIRCNSLASPQSTRASDLRFSSAVAIMRRKTFVSRASFLHVPILFLKSFLDTPSS